MRTTASATCRSTAPPGTTSTAARTRRFQPPLRPTSVTLPLRPHAVHLGVLSEYRLARTHPLPLFQALLDRKGCSMRCPLCLLDVSPALCGSSGNPTPGRTCLHMQPGIPLPTAHASTCNRESHSRTAHASTCNRESHSRPHMLRACTCNRESHSRPHVPVRSSAPLPTEARKSDSAHGVALQPSTAEPVQQCSRFPARSRYGGS